jgi:hypothetical protein
MGEQDTSPTPPAPRGQTEESEMLFELVYNYNTDTFSAEPVSRADAYAAMYYLSDWDQHVVYVGY